jgi:hypothetical protein
MQASRIDNIFLQARATATDADLPPHVCSLAATIEHMARQVAGDPAPARVDVFTLEQAVRILDRWVADHRGSQIEPPRNATPLADTLELPGL